MRRPGLRLLAAVVTFGAILSVSVGASAGASHLSRPGPPTDVSATTSYQSAVISWAAPTMVGQTPILGYTVEGSHGSGCSTSGATTCTLTGLATGIHYTVRVRAFNPAGTGPFSDPILITPSPIIRDIPISGTPSRVTSDGVHLWTTSIDNGNITEVESATGQIVRTIPDTKGPLPIASDGSHVWVGNFGDDTVTEIDADTGSVLRSIPVGGTPLDLSADGTHVWVSDGNYTITELDASTGNIAASTPVGDVPQGISSDGSHVWVVLGQYGIGEYSAVTGQLVRTIYLTTQNDHVASDGVHAWVTSFSNSMVTEIDCRSGATITQIPVQFANAISSDGIDVWVTGPVQNVIVQLKARKQGGIFQSLAVNSPGPLTGEPVDVAQNGGHVWIANGQGLIEVDEAVR